MSSVEAIPIESPAKIGDDQEDETSNDDVVVQAHQPPKQIIRYTTATLFSLRSSKLSQQKPVCKNMDLACMSHHKPPPKILIANMMPKFALNQMPNRGEESISPLSFHSNSSSSSNLSYQKRYQDGGNNGGDGYSNSRYYYNKYKNHDDNNGGGGGGSSRIIYKTTGANASNGNSIRFLKKAYNSKYEEQESSIGLISNKNILDNSSRVITAAVHRNSKLKKLDDDVQNDDKVNEKTNNNENNKSDEKKSPSDEANNNANDGKKESTKTLTEVNANDLMVRNDLKNLPDKLDMTNLDDIFNDLSINQLLDDKITDERESSRFSKWFNISQEEGKDAKLPDSQNNNNNNNNNITSNNDSNSSLFPQQDSESYFQPIDKVESNSLFQLLKGQPESQRNDSIGMHQADSRKTPMSPNSGQVHSVEELEAKLRQYKMNDEQDRKSNDSEKKVLQNFFQQQMPNLMQQQQQQQQHQQQPQQPSHQLNQNQEDINAFKKILSQITNDESKVSPQMAAASNGQNFLQQLMNKNFQPNPDMMMQYQKAFPMTGKIPNPAKMNPIGGASHMMPQQFGGNMDMKFIQQQQQPKIPPNPVPEIIKRPEVQSLVQELTSGEISQYNLWQRLTAPGLSPIEREIITCALNIFNANSGNAFPKQPIGSNLTNNLFPQAAAAGPLGGNQNPNVTTTQALHQLMQQQMKTNTLAAPIPMPVAPQTSPLSPVPPLDQHLLFQHQAAVAANKQLRLSPLPAGMPQRIPSPRELQYHTQSIMQNALIRKKLEEQRENFRKRQEQEKQETAKKIQHDGSSSASSSSSSTVEVTNAIEQNIITTMAPSQAQQEEISKVPMDSPTKKAPIVLQHHQIQRQHAPSPSIFTPTSVLRKMTAEKDSDGGKIGGIRMDDKKKSIAAIQQQQPIRNSQQQQFMNNISQMDRMKMQNDGVFGMNSWDSQPLQSSGIKPPVGRPIVKSSGSVQQNAMIGGQQNTGPSIMQSNAMNYDFQQQHMQKMNHHKYLQQQQMMQMKKQQMDNPVLSQFMAQQQQRAQTQFRSQFQPQQQQQQQQPQQGNFPSMMQGGRSDKQDDQMMENRNLMNNGGCLSPTSNQLAKWFSPELLADASAGKFNQLPTLNVGQMLSLEELEKCMQNS